MNHHFNLRVSNPNATAKMTKIRLAGIAAVALAGALGTLNLAHAQAKPDQTYDLEPGQGCEHFGLHIDIYGPQEEKEFRDKSGNVVRLFSGGKGATITYVNTTTQAMYRIKPNGSVTRTTINQDGTRTVTATGHNAISWFPTDVIGSNGLPAGPSTIQYTGKLVYTIDTSTGVFTLEGSSGKQIDICAALSSTP
jgi:hypothetical protein